MITSRRTGRGFTLIELLVVLSILVLLIALLLPTIKRTRQVARKIQCQSNLRQWMTATVSYVTEFRNTMPYSVWQDGGANWRGAWYDGFSGGKGSTVVDYAVATDHDSGLYCPSHMGAGRYGNYPGYQMNLNVATRCYTDDYHHFCCADQDQFVQYSRITKHEMTPFYHDAGEVGASIYFSMYGEGSFRPIPHARDYEERKGDMKYRHDGLANLVMLDGHVENIPGTFVGETGYGPGAGDVPDVFAHLYAEGKPFYWHFRHDPYKLY